MKKIILALLVIPCVLNAQDATIKVDIDRTIGEIDPNIYGVFMEPIQFNGERLGLPDTIVFNTLYGNLYDPDSPLANEQGFRKDYIDAMRELQIPNMRWPGGNFVSSYNWQDGIGPIENRPVRKDLAWGAIESNHVGTDEWVHLNRAIGSENVVCINMGLGTIDDARYWVEYCNLEKGTYYSDLRIKYGNPKPFDIRYWCLGNEVDGSPWIMGHKSAEDYCKMAIEAAKAMRNTDPSIKFISNGSSYYMPDGKWIDWNRTVIRELRNIADYISIHRYWDRTDDYYEYVGQSSLDIEEKINTLQAQVEVAKTQYPDMKVPALSIDEWAPFGQNMMTTMAVAMYFNSFIRHADFVKMANYTLATSLLGNDWEKGTFKTPLFYTYKLFSTHCRGKSVDTYVSCDTFNTPKYTGIPYLDVTSVYSEETATLLINVVNRHQDKTISAEILSNSIPFTGKASAISISYPDLKQGFEYDKQEEYVPEVVDIHPAKDRISYAFPPHSVNQLRITMKK